MRRIILNKSTKMKKKNIVLMRITASERKLIILIAMMKRRKKAVSPMVRNQLRSKSRRIRCSLVNRKATKKQRITIRSSLIGSYLKKKRI